MKNHKMFYPYRDLQVAGFAQVLAIDTLPRILTPIYRTRIRDQQVYYLFPPYNQQHGVIGEADVRSIDEFDEAVEAEEITSMDTRSLSAIADHELWVDDEGRIHYTPTYEAQMRLKSISKIYRIKARTALILGSYTEAQKFAITSFSARQNLKALYLRAEAEQRMGHRDELRLTQAMIEHELALKGFAPPAPGTPLKIPTNTYGS